MVTRRDFLQTTAASIGVLATALTDAAAAEHNAALRSAGMLGLGSLLDVDRRALLARSDLHYRSPVENSFEGQPIGNGVMGTMVWTLPSSIEFQINRVDVFAVNRNHHGGQAFPGWDAAADACGACARVTVDVGSPAFAKGPRFQQDLSLYDAECRLQGDGVEVRCFIAANRDVLVLEIDDRRPTPAPVKVTLALWGKPVEEREDHVARFAFTTTPTSVGELPAVTRTFTEADYYCAAAVAVQADRDLKRDVTTETSQTFVVPAKAGVTRILIGSAASMDKKVDVVAGAATPIAAAAGQTTDALRKAHQAWWHSFWGRSFVHLTSADGMAEFMEQVRAILIYVMASSARGKYPPKFNGMNFITNGDAREFGGQYWGWTLESTHNPLFAADAIDLLDPYFNMYIAQLPQWQIAAKQRWNAKGAYVSETLAFDGPQTVSEEVARQYRAILMHTEPIEELSEQTRLVMRYDSQMNPFLGGGFGVPAQVSHIFSSGSRIAFQAWWRYRYTGDTAWLRSYAYPILRESIEFYRSKVVKEADGRYHLYGSNVHESFLGVQDSIVDLAAMRATIPALLQASEILKADADMRPVWREFLEHLAPFPMGSNPKGARTALASDVWAAGYVEGGGDVRGDEDVWLIPVYPWEAFTLESRDAEMTRIVNKLMDMTPVRKSLYSGEAGGMQTTPRTPVVLARLGRGEELQRMLPHYFVAFGGRLANGFSTGYDGGSIEHLGIITLAVQEGLMQGLPPAEGEPEVIRVFPAWPAAWDGAFSLLARGGFLVSSIRTKGTIPFVEIESRLGGTCLVRNPWKGSCFVAEAGKAKEAKTGELIRFETTVGKRYWLFPNDLPSPIRIVPAAGTPTLKFTSGNGSEVVERIARD